MTDNQIAQRGIDAAQVLDNPAYVEGMEALRAAIVAKWEACPVRDTEGQRLLLQSLRLARDFETLLRGFVEAGKYADRKIEIDKHRNESTARKLMRRVL